MKSSLFNFVEFFKFFKNLIYIRSIYSKTFTFDTFSIPYSYHNTLRFFCYSHTPYLVTKDLNIYVTIFVTIKGDKYMTKKCILDLETECIDPKVGRIICIGIMDVETKESKVFAYPNEEMMVKNLISYFNRMKFTEIIGFNVLFDIRFLFAKCLKYKISARRLFSTKFTDLMVIMKSTRNMFSLNKAGTLDEWCEFLFRKRKTLNPENVSLLYQGGGIDEIVEYNKNDLEMTFRLWERIDYVMRL